MAVTGNVVLDPIVAQGCRPIGKPMKVTDCKKNLIAALDGKRAIVTLEKLLNGLEGRDRELAKTSLFLGVQNDPLKGGEAKGDYLIRNLIGLDPEQGVLAVGAYMRPGQTVQFHLRDRDTSSQDLKGHLDRYLAEDVSTSPKGALLFSCLGRGTNLYSRPNHDTQVFIDKVGQIPLGGFFCNGEIGPVDGATYLHGYTSCFGIFRPLEGQK